MKMARAGFIIGLTAPDEGRRNVVLRARRSVWSGHLYEHQTVAPAVGARRADCSFYMCLRGGSLGGATMEAIYKCVAGLDVHLKTVVACVRWLDDKGRLHKQVRTFGTMTRDLLELADWLERATVSHVAMESTGVYWKPIFY